MQSPYARWGFQGSAERSLEWWCSGQTIASGFQGARKPLILLKGSMGAGRVKSPPRGVNRRYGCMVRTGSMPRSRHRPEGCNGRAPASPLPSGVALACSRDEAGQTKIAEHLSDNTHLAERYKSLFSGNSFCCDGSLNRPKEPLRNELAMLPRVTARFS